MARILGAVYDRAGCPGFRIVRGHRPRLQRIGGIESMLTIVAGKVVYAGGPYQKLEEHKP